MDDRRLFIGITKTRLKNFTVAFDESGVASVIATTALCTESGKEIAEKSCYSQSWDNKGLEVPSNAHSLIMKLGAILHEASEKHIMKLDGLLDEKSN